MILSWFGCHCRWYNGLWTTCQSEAFTTILPTLHCYLWPPPGKRACAFNDNYLFNNYWRNTSLFCPYPWGHGIQSNKSVVMENLLLSIFFGELLVRGKCIFDYKQRGNIMSDTRTSHNLKPTFFKDVLGSSSFTNVHSQRLYYLQRLVNAHVHCKERYYIVTCAIIDAVFWCVFFFFSCYQAIDYTEAMVKRFLHICDVVNYGSLHIIIVCKAFNFFWIIWLLNKKCHFKISRVQILKKYFFKFINNSSSLNKGNHDRDGVWICDVD